MMENQRNQPKVRLETKTLGQVLGLAQESTLSLEIPEYQRIYCWEEAQVLRLLKDLEQHQGQGQGQDQDQDQVYHMGTIILHERKQDIQGQEALENSLVYDIIDGQQRLVTLSLVLLKLGQRPNLAQKTLLSEEAKGYIAYNKWLISEFLNKNSNIRYDSLLKGIQFSVLILSDSDNLDLAYTFFTANNNRGKSLSNYDLLKSHHLRFIQEEEQAEHVAMRWDELIRESDNDHPDKVLARTFEINLFRLRRWLRKKDWNDKAKQKIKNHFQAAAVIPEIVPPPSQVLFYSSIQGGTGFFDYAEQFTAAYKTFRATEPYKQLHQALRGETHWWYRDAIEALLFAYYLKFGALYLAEALVLISKKIAEQRYSTGRANLNTIFNHVRDSDIVFMLLQASSPSFFLAELKTVTDKLKEPESISGIRTRFKNLLEKMLKALSPSISTKATLG